MRRFFLVFSLILFFGNGYSQESPETMIRELYDLISFAPGEDVEWEAVRQLFIPEAVIVLRTAREKTETMGRDRFVELFIEDIEKHKLKEKGFGERIAAIKITEFGDIAQAFVKYEVLIPGREKPVNAGLDSMELMRTPEGWRIVAIVNEAEIGENRIPESVFE